MGGPNENADPASGAALATRQPVSETPAVHAPTEDAARTSVLARMLARGGDAAGEFRETTIASWSGQSGTLENGRMAALAASCLLRPAPGDRALVWVRSAPAAPEAGVADEAGDAAAACWVLGILQRPGDAATVLSTPGPLAIEAPRVGVAAGTVQIAADDFISSVRNRHAVEDTRTESARVRVADVGTDIRRATSAIDEVSGTALQRAGTWISNTVREARLRARTFLFD